MTRVQVLALGSLLLFSTVLGCSTTGGVSLRADGSPGPQECPVETLKLMRYLRLDIGEGADVELDLNQADTSPITLYDGPIESELTNRLGPFEAGTRLYGRVWTGGPQVVIRYFEARPPNGEITPICAVARLARGQMKKLPGSKPGTAIVEFSSAGVWVVDSFR